MVISLDQNNKVSKVSWVLISIRSPKLVFLDQLTFRRSSNMLSAIAKRRCSSSHSTTSSIPFCSFWRTVPSWTCSKQSTRSSQPLDCLSPLSSLGWAKQISRACKSLTLTMPHFTLIDGDVIKLGISCSLCLISNFLMIQLPWPRKFLRRFLVKWSSTSNQCVFSQIWQTKATCKIRLEEPSLTRSRLEIHISMYKNLRW